MKDAQKHLDSLNDIKDLMERSTKFISLSGLSGIIAGVTALVGTWITHLRLEHYRTTAIDIHNNTTHLVYELIIIASLVLIISLTVGFFLTAREAKKKNQKIWGKNSRILLYNMSIPLITGGLLSLIFIYHGYYLLIAPVMLLFYGMALINGSHYTLRDIRYLGFSEIILGLLSAFYYGYGIIFWALGFGVLHIIYGISMHFKYNTNRS